MMLQRIEDLVVQKKTFLITAHEKLDGDALGAELAFWHLLKGMGKEATIYNQDPTPGNYRFLPGSERIVNSLPPLDGFEVAVILDCSELERVGKEAGRLGSIPHLINIDHHVSNGGFCEATFLDSEASSTGELVFRLVGHLGETITPPMATALYTAILTDTGGFRYGNTSPQALAAAAALVEAGARPQWISENVYESNPPEKLRLLAEVLPTLSLEAGGRVASLTVLQRMFAASGALPEHTEGFVDIPRTIHGVDVSVLFSELPDGRFKVSMRSKGQVDVEQVARAFGGGGHLNAAACRLEGDLPEVRRRIIEEIGTVLER